MKSFIRPRVVKSYDVQVATPHLVDCQIEEFRFLTSHLTVLTTNSECNTLNQDYIEGQQLETLNLESENQINNDSEVHELVKAKAQADQIIEDASIKAAELIQNADAEAARILQKVKEDEAKLRTEISAAVRKEITPKAEKEGIEQGFRKGQQEAASIIKEAKTTLELAKHVLQQEYAKVDEILLQFALKIAERLARLTIELKPERLKEVINELTLLPQEREGWRLHVSPEEAEWLSQSEIVQLPCPWVRDDALQPGECFLECQEGIFDARFQSQLAKMEQFFKEEFKREEMGQFSPET